MPHVSIPSVILVEYKHIRSKAHIPNLSEAQTPEFHYDKQMYRYDYIIFKGNFLRYL